MKIQKGITLIGLVITIIVIIILAGVTISMVIGDNGVLLNAQNAAIAGVYAREEEQVKTAAMAAMAVSSTNGNIGIEKQYFDEELKKEFGTGNYSLEEETDKFIVTILGTGNSYEIDKFGNVTAKPSEGGGSGSSAEDPYKDVEPGLYAKGTTNLLKSWEELKAEELISVEEGTLSYVDTTLDGDLIISSEVTSLGRYLFGYNYCGYMGPAGHKLKGIYVPSSITSLEYCAFAAAAEVEWIRLPEEIELVGESIFMNCEKLISVNLPQNITFIPGRIFVGCKSLTNIDIPDTVTEIGVYAFSQCISLENLDFLPKGITEIPQRCICSVFI